MGFAANKLDTKLIHTTFYLCSHNIWCSTNAIYLNQKLNRDQEVIDTLKTTSNYSLLLCLPPHYLHSKTVLEFY